MTQIKPLSIIKETFISFFGNVPYIIKKLYPQIIALYGIGFIFLCQYKAFMAQTINLQDNTVLKISGFIFLGLIMALAYVNYAIGIIQLGVSKKIEAKGFLGFGVGRIHLKILGFLLICVLFGFLVGLPIGMIIALEGYTILKNTVFIIGFIALVYLVLRMYVVFPSLAYTNTLGFSESWALTKGKVLRILALTVLVILIMALVSILISLPEIISVSTETEQINEPISYFGLFIEMTYQLCNVGITYLMSALVYKKLKGE